MITVQYSKQFIKVVPAVCKQIISKWTGHYLLFHCYSYMMRIHWFKKFSLKLRIILILKTQNLCEYDSRFELSGVLLLESSHCQSVHAECYIPSYNLNVAITSTSFQTCLIKILQKQALFEVVMFRAIFLRYLSTNSTPVTL